MLTGSCHCGAVHWTFDGMPEAATACNCTICRRYGALWIYGHEGEGIAVTGPQTAYVRPDLTGEDASIAFGFCGTCGCVGCWRAIAPDATGRHRIAVNLRMSEPEAVAHIPVRHFDGLTAWANVPDDGRSVRHMWF